MKFSIHIKSLVFQVFLATICFGQSNNVDSLRKVLPTLKDTARVDCLNNLAIHYLLAMQKDSMTALLLPMWGLRMFLHLKKEN